MADVIREQIKVGEVYAFLNPSLHDRSLAVPFEITEVPDGGPYVWGYRSVLAGVTRVSSRMLRMTWQDWIDGKEPEPKHYKHKKPAEWLRRIANHPDASPELALAARNQLEAL